MDTFVPLAGTDASQSSTHAGTFHVVSVSLFVLRWLEPTITTYSWKHLGLCWLILWGFVILILVVLGVNAGVSLVSAGLRL